MGIVKLLLFIGVLLQAASTNGQQQIMYGNNAAAGRYQQVGDARIYYEVYGKGAPIVLLHGGLFGYISEYEQVIPRLAQTNQVIAIASRGHGKSEIGTSPFSYQLLAQDAYQIIKSLTKDSVIVIGFSTGGQTAYMLAARHPQVVKKVISIGASPLAAPTENKLKKSGEEEKLTGKSLEKDAPEFVKERKALMPEPARWNEFVEKLTTMWENPDYLTKEQVKEIQAPVLIVAGDQDPYVSVERNIQLYRLLPKANLSLIPACEHIVLYCNFEAVWESIIPFIDLRKIH